MSISDYLNKLNKERLTSVEKIIELARNSIPEFTENMDYKMPTFYLGEYAFCAVASQKNYISFYLMPHDFLEAFKVRIKDYNHGKSCLRFKEINQKEVDLLKDIIEYSIKNYSKSEFYGNKNLKMK